MIENTVEFDHIEELAQLLDEENFQTYYLHSKFDYETQNKYEALAKEYGYIGEIYHPIIYATDGNKKIYDGLYQS